MIKNLVRKTSIFYQLSVAILILGTLSVIYFFWVNGSLKQNENNGIYETSFIYKNIEKHRSFNSISKFVKNGDIKNALSELENFEDKLNVINSHVKSDHFKILITNVEKLKTNLASFVKYPKRDEVIKILEKKIAQFYQFAKENNWRRLTRMSDRAVSIVRGSLGSKDIREIQSLISEMNEVVENSVLKRNEKSEIFTKLSSMDIEFKMLNNFKSDISQLDQKIDFFENSLKEWMNAIAPTISESILKGQQTNKQFILYLLGVIAVAVVFFIAGYFVNNHWIESGQRVLEANMVDIVENLVRNKTIHSEQGFSESFYHSISKNAAYANKRMNFGLLFQNTIPFPAMLLDANLKVIWANNSFSESWGISEDKIASQLLGWDLLKKQTNLNESTPIIDALKNNLSGIYQLKVRNEKTSQSAPYEMYVRPVKMNNEVSIMIYFYPLENVQDTIELQAKTILAPIKETVHLLSSNVLESSTFTKLETKFEEAGVIDLYKDIKKLVNDWASSSHELQNKLSSKLNQEENLLNEISKYENQISQNYNFSKEIAQSFKLLKQKIIDYSVLKENLVTGYDKYMNDFFNINDKFSSLINLYNNDHQLLINISKTAKDINSIRFSLKSSKQQLDESLVRLKADHRNDKDKVSVIKSVYAEFSKALQDLEVKISKIENLVNENESQLNFELDTISIDNEDYKKLEYFKNQFHTLEEELVCILKEGYGAYRKLSYITKPNKSNNEEITIN